jgi:hypothetical protein
MNSLLSALTAIAILLIVLLIALAVNVTVCCGVM